MVVLRKGSRSFICKDCGKRSNDQWGGFKRYDTKNEILLEYENVDLCRKCFKKFRKAQAKFYMIQTLFAKKLLNEENVKKFNEDKQFRFGLIKKYFVAKAGDLKKKNQKYIDDLRRSQRVDRDFQVLFN